MQTTTCTAFQYFGRVVRGTVYLLIRRFVDLVRGGFCA